MLFTTLFFSDLILYFLYYKKKNTNNYFLSSFMSLLSIPIYLIIFIPVYYLIGENFIFSIVLMLGVIVLIKFFKYKLLNYKNMYLECFSIILIIITYLIFLFLTYYPIRIDLFLDPISNCFGICK